MWAYESVFYQIYPIGFCGAPRVNDGVTVPRIRKVSDWAEHIASLGCNAVYFSRFFESDGHGYDTRDFRRWTAVSAPTGFAAVCKTLHEHGIKVAGWRIQSCRTRFLGVQGCAGKNGIPLQGLVPHLL
ncbi:MAG: hypothetical protein ACLT4C_10835 [Butyricicoccus sp.]